MPTMHSVLSCRDHFTVRVNQDIVEMALIVKVGDHREFPEVLQ